MFLQLSETLEIIKKLNKNSLEKKIDQKLIEEQSKNLHDLKDLLEKFSKITKFMSEKNKVEVADMEYFFAHTHAALMNLVWHIEEMDNLLLELAKSIPEKKPQE